jgi:iron-sulfur cluster repair protein YtfE (RIC family)
MEHTMSTTAASSAATTSTPGIPGASSTREPPSVLNHAIRAHHRTLAETLDGYAGAVEAGITGSDAANLTALLNAMTDFLSSELLTHARGEEQTLYPALDPIIREYGSPTATMRVDHEYIAEYVRQITETVRGLRSAGEREQAMLAQRLTRQVLQLQALFAVHLAKEERVYLPLIEQAISAGDQQALLAALHAEAEGGEAGASAGDDTAADALEVRHLPPA